MKTVSRTDSPVELGQWLARQLLETPVKNAVREALEEEGVTRREQQEERISRQEQSETQQSDAANTSDDSSTGPPAAVVVAGLAAVGVVAYLLRQRRSDSDYPTRPSDVDEQTAAGDRVEAEAPVDTED